ncbi:phosphopantothenate--cysteine ligase [Streptococcus sp. DD13]|uniref:phosphopantothenate--cysteine ligase n=1 Tax=Streptococcus sp. DD13 TaxID=1777881 RepID=UPI00079A2E6C|nr:phosphopantothenate--cysteine ligase [Streptococcus sp. DD13]KXT78759.1 Phosphopantothenoylcysteine synthetase [Streptococcus sp. DD13]
MKVLITSGGTSEPIDSVRSITNHSTGRLGAKIAETYLTHGDEVTLITTKRSEKPASHPHLTIILVDTVKSLEQALQEQVPHHDVIVHSMAVSDYSPTYMTGLDSVLQTEDLQGLAQNQNQELKISSSDEIQVLFLKKTPKLISMIKKWNPAIRLIGFKLLVGVSLEELLHVARESLKKNHADFIVANDLHQIDGDQHLAYLLSQDQVEIAHTKDELADLIYRKTKG